MHWSEFANDLVCQYCWMKNQVNEWPLAGDRVGFYYQKEKGNFNLTVNCSHCGKEWYVVWDEIPGPIQPLTI